MNQYTLTGRQGTREDPFLLLHPKLQKWVWEQGWRELRPIQAQAIPLIKPAAQDVIIAAATAGGKTEAAFLPILSRILDEPQAGIRVLTVSPLKALINDQHYRLEGMTKRSQIPVHRWHGDVSASQKRALLRKPEGVLLITPESLEANFILRGNRIPQIFAGLSFVVIDELHSFIGTERGQQLASLLHRLERAVSRFIPRIALSATLGDMGLACEYLRPGGEVTVIDGQDHHQEIRLQVRGYVRRVELKTAQLAGSFEEDDSFLATEELEAVDDVERHLFEQLRGGKHLVFANARTRVEKTADRLRSLSRLSRVPNEFWPHHGSLSKDLRHEAERSLKDPSRPATVVATTTLEMGIDVGSVETIAQIGSPPSVASLRQRLGRSGRDRDQAAVLRIYIEEDEITPRSRLQDSLRCDLFKATAMVELLLQGWYEPPSSGALHLSTLVQQVLSLIAQWGGIRADRAWQLLCRTGPFTQVDSATFAALLRDLAEHELITQLHNGEITLGLPGEKLVNHYDFYTAFSSPEEYRLTTRGKVLGSLPILYPLFEGLQIIFAGKRWKVTHVDDAKKVVDLIPAAGGRLPSFWGTGALVHGRVRSEMKRLYEGDEIPRYLNRTARELLLEGRENYSRFGLESSLLLPDGEDTFILPWLGDSTLQTLLLWLSRHGAEAHQEGIALILRRTDVVSVKQLLQELREQPCPKSLELASLAKNLEREKHHRFLSRGLLARDFAATSLDLPGAKKFLQESVHTLPS